MVIRYICPLFGIGLSDLRVHFHKPQSNGVMAYCVQFQIVPEIAGWCIAMMKQFKTASEDNAHFLFVCIRMNLQQATAVLALKPYMAAKAGDNLYGHAIQIQEI
jgi:hypothetical protein